MSAPDLTLRVDDGEAIEQLRTALARGRYDGPSVDEALALPDQPFSRDPAEIPLYLRLLPPGRPQSTLIKLFLLNVPADRDEAAAALAPLLLALVSMGIYAVVSYTVAHRTAEIGVRIALGATADRVVKLIVKESMSVIAAGITLAWVIALMVDLHLFAGGADDLPMMLGVPLLLLAVATVACWLPARRATLVDPIAALRSD